MIKLLRYLIICLICVASHAYGENTYYVDASTGNDMGSGLSEYSAWKTISKVNTSSFSPGDLILLKKGEVWREQLIVPSSGSSGNPITFGAYGTGAAPIIHGADLINNWSQYQTNVWTAQMDSSTHQVLFNGKKGNNKNSITDIKSENDWYWETGNLYVFSYSDPDISFGNPGIEASNRDHCIISVGKEYITLQHLNLVGSNFSVIDISNGKYGGEGYHVISDIDIRDGASNGILLMDGSGHEVHNCIISGFGRPGERNHGIMLYKSSSSYSVANCILSGNTISKAMGCGILISATSNSSRLKNAIIANNVIFNNGDGININYSNNCTIKGNSSFSNATQDTNAEQYGISLRSSSYNQISQNTLYSNGAHGIEIWGENGLQSNGNSVHSNLIHTNQLDGICFSSIYSDNNDVYYNIVFSNSRNGFSAGGANSGNLFANNTLYDNEYYEVDFHNSASGWTYQNNIAFHTGSQYPLYAVSTNIVFSNNCYFNASGGYVAVINSVGYTSSTISNFESTAVSANPLFSNPNNRIFTLQDSSPCIDAGTDVSLTQDYAGNPVPYGAAVDIGAFEYNCKGCGDVNGDLVISPGDAQTAFTIFLGVTPNPTACEEQSADVNRDGIVTPADAQAIFDSYIGKIDLPCSTSNALNNLSLPENNSFFMDPDPVSEMNFPRAEGTVIAFPIIVDNSSVIHAFGFDLLFPSEQLEFIGFESDELQDICHLDASKQGPGLIRAGGYVNVPLADLRPRILITLIFKVNGEQKADYQLAMANAVDDIKTIPCVIGVPEIRRENDY